jgi:hypothetical protein
MDAEEPAERTSLAQKPRRATPRRRRPAASPPPPHSCRRRYREDRPPRRPRQTARWPHASSASARTPSPTGRSTPIPTPGPWAPPSVPSPPSLVSLTWGGASSSPCSDAVSAARTSWRKPSLERAEMSPPAPSVVSVRRIGRERERPDPVPPTSGRRWPTAETRSRSLH